MKEKLNGLMADKENRVFFSAFSAEGMVTGTLKFPNIVLTTEMALTEPTLSRP